MTKEKKKALNFDTDLTYPKLLKFLHESKSKGYKTFNIVTDDNESIYSQPFEELATCEGQVFFSEDKIEELAQRELGKRLRVIQQEK
jgi:hypothetical protein